jgi:hypothetical protein
VVVSQKTKYKANIYNGSNICLPLQPSSPVEILMPKGIIVGMEAFERCLVHEGGFFVLFFFFSSFP